ncbi:MAG: hypothetical protein H0V81_03785 [Solirubrobacterales bacterium]|nr:hypothetical protein [Solirubrobacterales bacterium]
MSERGNLISVRSDVAASLLIDGLFDAAVGHLEDPVAPELARALDGESNPRAARLGYLARLIEVERFPVANVPIAWLSEALAGSSPEALSTGLAFEEPLAKPAPADGPPSWRIPGPGGHVRHFLALRAVGEGPAEDKRSWLFGFFLACCRESSCLGDRQPRPDGGTGPS